MLQGKKIALRDRRREDVEVRHRAEAGDHVLHAFTDYEPWTPQSLDQALARYDKRLAEDPDPKTVWFAVQRRDDPEGRFVGGVGLWGIEEHQRTAHIGIGLIPECRGQGFGREAVALMAFYAFRIRDLFRLQIETLATNHAMLGAARGAGFVLEGTLRQGAYVMGERVDDCVLGLLRPDWEAQQGPTALDGVPGAV